MDILRTIRSCIEEFSHPAQSVAPYAARLWNSLKYEVLNGEVDESINGTLDIIRSLSRTLSDASAETIDAVSLNDFVSMSLADCIEDLSNSSHAKPAGLLITAVAEGSITAFSLSIPQVLQSTKTILGQSRQALYARDLVSVLNRILAVRYKLLGESGSNRSDSAMGEFYNIDPLICELMDSVYLRLWRAHLVDQPDAGQVALLKEIMRGFGEFVRQQGRSSGTERTTLLTPAQSAKILQVLAPLVICQFRTPVKVAPHILDELAHEAVITLHKAAPSYLPLFEDLVNEAFVSILGTPRSNDASLAGETQQKAQLALAFWKSPPHTALVMLKEQLSWLAFIGCSADPPDGTLLKRFTILETSLLRLLDLLLREHASFKASTIVLSGIYNAMLHFRGSCHRGDLINLSNGALALPVLGEEDLSPGYKLPAIDGENQLAQLRTFPDRKNSSPLFQQYLRSSLSIVEQLYRRATRVVGYDSADKGGIMQKDLGADFAIPEEASGSQEAIFSAVHHQDQYLHQLASLAAFVVRDLDESEQKTLELHREAFDLFHPLPADAPLGRSMFDDSQDGRLDVLSMGILQGLHPAVVAGIVRGLAPPTDQC